MIPKSADGRHRRRKRYIEAIEPFRKRYGCTAAQVYDHVNGELVDAAHKVRESQKKVEKLEAKAEAASRALDLLSVSPDASEAIQEKLSEISKSLAS